jgi:hypothetical protein
MKITIALLCLCMLFPAAGCGARDEGFKHGKTLVGEFKVPPAILVKFDEFKPSERKPGESALEANLLASTEVWNGPMIEADSTANPYKIVMTVSATAKADGDAVSMWQAGWNVGEGEARMSLMSGLTRSNLKAGQTFTATGVSGPVSFKKDREVGVRLELVRAENMEINSVDVAVWSGIGGSTFLERFGAFTYVLIALVMFVLWWFWFRKPKTDMDL